MNFSIMKFFEKENMTFFKSDKYLKIVFAFQCRKFEEAGADIKLTPCDVIDATDITFSCVSDPQAAKDVSSLFISDKIIM